MGQFPEVDPNLDLPALDARTLELWHHRKVFQRSVDQRAGAEPYVFYEGPPTANGRPGVHHVEARSFKDLFPRFKTMRGYRVDRKGGWDCHGLPVELEVEKELGLKDKQAIETYGVEAFNARCRESVERYVDAFEQLTERIGFWIDTSQAYRTMDTSYVESVWWPWPSCTGAACWSRTSRSPRGALGARRPCRTPRWPWATSTSRT